MPTIKCPHCGKEVRIISFGGGYVAVCCDQVIYNGYKLPQYDEKDVVAKVIEQSAELANN